MDTTTTNHRSHGLFATALLGIGVIVNRRTIAVAALATGLLVQTEGFTFDKPSPPTRFLIEPTGAFPGQVALGWYYYLTARDGGGQTVDALITSATSIGPNERFTVEQVGNYLAFKTADGNYISVTDGVSNATQVTQTVLPYLTDTTLFSFTPYYSNVDPPGVYLTTYYDYDLYWIPGRSTAAMGDSPAGTVPEGGARTGFNPQQCGDLGSGYHYSILMEAPGLAPKLVPSQELAAIGGRIKDGIYVETQGDPNAQFTLILQDDGSYALQTSNGINYVTAAGGGGWAHGTAESDTLHTDATRVGTWEKFRIIDQGNCTYTLQTNSGYYVGYNLNDNDPSSPGKPLSLSTRISDPAAAASIGYSAYFVLRPLWN
jgi:hypothetical protein